MPVSPANRVRGAGGLRVDNHKRGQSFESAILFRERDDDHDLALFNEVQNRELDAFLLHSNNDDFDDVFSTKLRYFSDYKLGISIPARGESSDLLKAEKDKNDYDWLITPPDTPLFPSLDDEAPPVSLVPRGRLRGQPIAMSRSSTMEKGNPSARSSASPHRFSPPPPRSGNSPLQHRSRQFSATHASPPPTLRHYSPSRRLSPPPSKPSPAGRFGTPSPRRTNSCSSDTSGPSRARGTSPIKTARGSSASPKIKAWQSNISGFLSEAPPNLRTSLADRPASYVRGSSPTSRNSSRSDRQSISPTATRSMGSSQSLEKGQFSSYSKSSIVSSGNDDRDSQQSNCITSLDHSVSQNTDTFPNNRAMGFSKKPNKILSNSAPKRSLDLVLRQMDRKSPQNMFRPLLSSVPSSTFYVGKANVHQCPVASRNSSITTSSNGSSFQGMSGAPDMEESIQNPDDVACDFMAGQYSAVHEEALTEAADDTSGCHGENDVSVAPFQSGVAESHLEIAVLDRKYGSSDMNESQDMEVCSGCNLGFHPSELSMEGDQWLCHECKHSEVNSEVRPVMTSENDTEDFFQILECGLRKDSQQSDLITGSVQINCCGERGPKLNNDLESIAGIPGGLLKAIVSPDKDTDTDTGVSLMFKGSNVAKRYIVHSKSFTASNTSYDDFSYVRGSSTSMRSSIGHSSASLSSSIDLGSSRQSDTHIHWQSIGQKSDTENYRYVTSSKHRRSVSSLSCASGNPYQVSSVAPSCPVDSLELVASSEDKDFLGVTCDQSLAPECTEVESTCTVVESNIIPRNAAELSSQLMDDSSGRTSVVSEEQESHESGGNIADKSCNFLDGETLSVSQTCGEREDGTQSSCVSSQNTVPHRSSLDAISEMEVWNFDNVSADVPATVGSPNINKCRGKLTELCVSVMCDDAVTTAVGKYGMSVPINNITDERCGTKSRSLTLEEATDTILFCSSIVHNIAYEAADIATTPTTTFVDKTNSDRRDVRLRTLGKRNSRSQKTRLETKLMGEADENSSPPPQIVRCRSKLGSSSSVYPPKLESKCNCRIM
ncbi:uncharacterized protein LOC127241365 [Andrographis paniculata]|uniref:uncharacterized protein LOC127241365 n=1 Tax=Andrographis paniculata TaxID=175694 RepID=UPI0021E93ABD|nr:uncharacterized protein LOC127241365 [Andrographis paniculata]XP_051116334.1 uncharacterized protein LOC127241365 [Andrographis paniculata]XP_051116335.1 uncharacterized protein LOC127241365 [Andrographis paniculata]XP_051116336.1 uncharacterized protein LOC127241365 [Andrographis paniculata]